MNGVLKVIYAAFLFLALTLTGCIHEYPTGSGIEPSRIDAYLQLNFDLKWESMLHRVDLSTRASTTQRNRFIIEVKQGEEILGRDEFYLSSQEFAEGQLKHRLTFPLKAESYQIGVWHDVYGEVSNESPFDAVNLSAVKLKSQFFEDGNEALCSFASTDINLRKYQGERDATATVTLELQHPGARFEIVTTDINEFISQKREDLLAGESFSVLLNFSEGASRLFDCYNGRKVEEEKPFDIEGELFLPFADYDRLMIACGYIFCNKSDESRATLSILNSAKVPVARTSPFYFPVKRGMITTLVGDFLTSPFDSPLDVETKWDGEIVIEVD